MCVPVHDDVGVVGGEEAGDGGCAEFVAVAHVDANAVHRAFNLSNESGVVGVVAVAGHGVGGGDEVEFHEHVVAAHVTGVQDEGDACERAVYVGAKLTMRIRNQPDHDGRRAHAFSASDSPPHRLTSECSTSRWSRMRATTKLIRSSRDAGLW